MSMSIWQIAGYHIFFGLRPGEMQLGFICLLFSCHFLANGFVILNLRLGGIHELDLILKSISLLKHRLCIKRLWYFLLAPLVQA